MENSTEYAIIVATSWGTMRECVIEDAHAPAELEELDALEEVKPAEKPAELDAPEEVKPLVVEGAPAQEAPAEEAPAEEAPAEEAAAEESSE